MDYRQVSHNNDELDNVSCKLVSGCKASIIMTSTSVLLLCLATITIVASLTSFRPGVSSMEKLFDFNSEEEFTNDEAGNWYESSDTVRLENDEISLLAVLFFQNCWNV